MILGDKLRKHGVQRSMKAFHHAVTSWMIWSRPNLVDLYPLAELVNELTIELLSLVTPNLNRKSKPAEELIYEYSCHCRCAVIS